MKRLGLLVVMCSLVPLAASAGTVTVAWMGGPRVDAYYGGTDGSGGTRVATYAGDFKVTNSVADPVPGLQQAPFYTFCVDLQHYSTSSSKATLDSMANWGLFSGASPEQLAQASWVGSQYFASLRPTGSTAAATIASYQIAIWELLYERSGTFSAFGGGGTAWFAPVAGGVDDAILNAANALVTASASHTNFYEGWLRTDDPKGTSYAQDFMAPVPDSGATAALMGLSMLGLAFLKRLRG